MTDSRTPLVKTVNASGPISTARKLMLVALVVHLLSLFLPYRDSEKEGSIYYVEKWHVEGIQGMSQEKTGFEEKPYAVYVIIGLLVLFGTDLYQEAAWRRFVYWASFVLLVVFAFGGAPFRTSGGKLAMLCLATVLVAGYLDRKGRKQTKAIATTTV